MFIAGLRGCALDSLGNIYIVEPCDVRVIMKTDQIYNNRLYKADYGYYYAGTGVCTQSYPTITGTSIPSNTPLWYMFAIAIDSKNNVYISMKKTSVYISILIVPGFAQRFGTRFDESAFPDLACAYCGSVTSLLDCGQVSMAVDSSGNIFYKKSYCNNIRQVASGSFTSTSVVGTGSSSVANLQLSGVSPATVSVHNALSLTVDSNDNLYFGESNAGIIRVLKKSDNKVYLIASSGATCKGSNCANVANVPSSFTAINFMSVTTPGNLFVTGKSGNGQIKNVAF